MVFASSSAGGIAGSPSSRLNFIDCLLMDYKNFLSSGSLTKWRRVKVFIKTDNGRLVAKLTSSRMVLLMRSWSLQP